VGKRPSPTVAAVIERGGLFLLVEEESDGKIMMNQPAGHLEQHESLVEACGREVLEEAAWHFQPSELVGIYRWHSPANRVTYLRFAFCGVLGEHEDARKLDKGIVRAVWLDAQEIRDTRLRHRSPMVLRCVEDYLAGRRYPLDILVEHE
jgi:8-oxo-dGTP pyrophosphatase MutT (NUDIX family)